MKIKNITIKNYKFHHNLDFEIKKQNGLIYGENGTGKSSIYKALYSNFYFYKDNKIVNNKIVIKEKFIHRDYSNENLEVNIALDTNNLNRKNNDLYNPELLKNQTIYFADEKVFHKITQNDFYQVINSELIKHFPQLSDLDSIYRTVKTSVNRSNVNEQEEIVKERQEADILFIEKFKELIPTDEVNKILNSLNENFEIEFEIKNSDIEFDNGKFIEPKIAIKVKDIDDKGDFKNHFNEAKLKLISIAIYFALAKKYEIDSELKLLVLDDFLTSLDMANRKLIIQYILENFGEYQKVVLTHNIQFYNLIIRLLYMKNEKESWDIKRLFLSKISSDTVSEMRDEKSFLDQAKERLKSGDLQSSGNFLRKEFERIVHEFEMLLELGKVEDMSNILDILKEPNVYYSNPHDTINQLISSFEKIVNLPIDDTLKVSKIEEKIKKIKDCKIDLSRAEILDDGTTEQHSLLLSLQKTNFYNGIILNSLSHDDVEIEAYRKECINIIELLSSLNRGLTHLKGKKYN